MFVIVVNRELEEYWGQDVVLRILIENNAIFVVYIHSGKSSC